MPFLPTAADMPAPGDTPDQQQPQQPAGGISSDDALKAILQLAEIARGSGDLDQQDLLKLEQLRTTAQQILADIEKGSDSMMGGKMDPRALRRATGGQGY